MTQQNDTKDANLALGGDMAWKKALFLGGAVLLLAACSDATAPNALQKNSGRAAIMSTAAPAGLLPGDGSVQFLGEECRSGYYVRSGDKDVCAIQLDLP